jgi:L-lactate dehydrogenase complex protein LldG
MSAARDQILGSVRAALKRGKLDARAAAELDARIGAHQRNLIPKRAAALDARGQVELFVDMAQEVQTTVERVAAPTEVPTAVADYLAAHNLPAEFVMSPDARLDALPWQDRPLLKIRRGKAERQDLVGVTPCFAAIAETGTLMLLSGPGTPSTINFIPDTHIVVMQAGEVVATYEDGWDRLRAQGDMPRTVNFVTGPSRTGDIEQRLVLGAHGPRRLHIVLVDPNGAATMRETSTGATRPRTSDGGPIV